MGPKYIKRWLENDLTITNFLISQNTHTDLKEPKGKSALWMMYGDTF